MLRNVIFFITAMTTFHVRVLSIKNEIYPLRAYAFIFLIYEFFGDLFIKRWKRSEKGQYFYTFNYLYQINFFSLVC